MALPFTNIDTDAVQNALGASTGDIGELCSHANVNKWGLQRSIVAGATAAARLTSFQSTVFYLDEFAGYNHTESPAGIATSAWQVLDKTEQTVELDIRSFGQYTITRRKKDFGGSWTNVANNDASWFRVTLPNSNDANHRVLIDATSGHVTGNNPLDNDIANVLTAAFTVEVDAYADSLNKEREFEITLNHPDSADGDAYDYIIVGKQKGDVLTLSVLPATLNDFDDTGLPSQTLTVSFQASSGSYRVEIQKIDTGSGTSWFSVLPASNITTSPTNVGVQCTKLTSGPPYERSGIIRFKMVNTSTLEVVLTQDVGVYQVLQI